MTEEKKVVDPTKCPRKLREMEMQLYARVIGSKNVKGYPTFDRDYFAEVCSWLTETVQWGKCLGGSWRGLIKTRKPVVLERGSTDVFLEVAPWLFQLLVNNEPRLDRSRPPLVRRMPIVIRRICKFPDCVSPTCHIETTDKLARRPVVDAVEIKRIVLQVANLTTRLGSNLPGTAHTMSRPEARSVLELFESPPLPNVCTNNSWGGPRQKTPCLKLGGDQKRHSCRCSQSCF